MSWDGHVYRTEIIGNGFDFTGVGLDDGSFFPFAQPVVASKPNARYLVTLNTDTGEAIAVECPASLSDG